jgi:hypothetical protein
MRTLNNTKILGGLLIGGVKMLLNSYNHSNEWFQEKAPEATETIKTLGMVKGGIEVGDRWSKSAYDYLTLEQKLEEFEKAQKEKEEVKG